MVQTAQEQIYEEERMFLALPTGELLSFGEAEYHIKKGDKLRFWHDAWRGGIPLKIQFSSVFEICNKPDAIVNIF